MTASPDAGRHAAVVIVGGGPVGLSMALELAFHGVGSLLIEPRAKVEHSRPRAKTTSARTMELYRRTGAAAEIRRRAPIPAEWSDEVRFCTTATGHEITRLTGVLGLELVNSDLTAEGAQQVTQPIVEEVLRSLLAERPSVATLYGSRVIDVDLDADRPRVRIEDAEGVLSTVTCDYLVGADGSRSVVRAALGAHYVGAAAGRPNVNITFRSAQLGALLPKRRAVHHWVLNPEFPGVIGPLSLDGTWWAISTGTETIADDDEAAALVRGLVGADIDVEILATDPWQARMLLTDCYGSDRTYLVGDAAHQNPPWGGHGFNTGVGDAVNLAWKLAAVLSGWAPVELLESYEDERMPVAEQTIDLAATNMQALSIDLTSPELMAEGAAGDQARAAAAGPINNAKRAEFYSLGLVLGYGYGPNSSDQTPSGDVYLPVVAAGNRLPHARSAAGKSLYDLLGPELTLIGAPGQAWVDAASRRGIPLVCVDPSSDGFGAIEPDRLVLVRPDQHIAWVGPSFANPDTILDSALRGFVSRSPAPSPIS
ncbi:FAD-dependent monooxygenase [Cryobacterium sp. GrIS_2_6]|uniref:FAD-dependent monooxygenase n=1 Tax=Cryobacterium sp. GrIS_2_6 TaxID=3162785 RepID=UPI002E09CAC2|nr:FAD-dependent monooxygenase [Cryobacterium psychrotolerans]MEC5151942.1 2-polyprenyl-6-methoxyphenol hydroxylase-like FAD-dependent oxidoreductase [Cryobacterium psychrotolerans]